MPFVHTTLYVKLQLIYLTNLLFFIKKCSTDSAQKHMPHTLHSHQYYVTHFEWVMSLSQLKKKRTLKNHSLFTCDLEDQISPLCQQLQHLAVHVKKSSFTSSLEPQSIPCTEDLFFIGITCG